MLKTMFFAAAVTGLAIGATLPLQSTSAEATPSGCSSAAKHKYPGAGMHKERRMFRKECRGMYKAHKAAVKAAKKAA